MQLSHDPNIICVQFQWDEWQLHEWMHWWPISSPISHQYRHWTMLLGVLLNLLCPVHTYRLTILKVFFVFALTLRSMIIITMIHTVTCHVCHLWIKPVSLGKYRQLGYTNKWMVEFVSGVDQENVLLGQHAVQDWTPLDSYGTSWGELFVPEPPCRISVRLWKMSGMLYHSSVVPRLIFSMRRRYEAVVAAFGGSTQC